MAWIMTSRIDQHIDYCLANPSQESHRSLLSYAALDLSLGHLLRDQRRDPEWFKEDVQAALEAALPSSGSLALLDTTTLLNAVRILDRDFELKELHAGAVFDLATFIGACVFEDRVLFLRNHATNAERVSRLVEGLQVMALPWGEDDDFSLVVDSAWGDAERLTPELFTAPGWRDLYVEHWSRLVGQPVSAEASNWPSNYRKYFSSIDSYAVQTAILETDMSYDVLNPIGLSVGLTEKFITESSIRTVFHSLLANIFGATYYASSYRSRLRDSICEAVEANAVTHQTRLLQFLDENFRDSVRSDDFIRADVQMPFLLSAALGGATSPVQVCERIASMRRLAEPLRARRRDLEQALRAGNAPAIRSLAQAVTEDAALLAKAESDLGDGMLSRLLLSPGGARPVLGALGKLILSLSKLPDDVKAVLKQRLVRPELWVVTRLAAQAQKTLACLDPLYDLLRPKGLELGAFEKQLNLEMLKRLSNE